MPKISVKDIFKLLKKNLKQPLIRNVLTVGLVTLGIKGVSFYKELVVAENFGLSELLDTFLIAMLIPGFINTVFLGSYKNVFIPNYVLELKQKGKIGSFQASSFIITVSIALFFILLTYLFADVYIETVFPGHTEKYYDLIKLQLRFLLPCILIWALGSKISGLLNIDNDYFHSSVASVFAPLGTIIALWLFRDVLQEKVLAIGLLGGSSISLIYLLVISIKRKIILLRMPDFTNSNVKQLIKQVPAKVSSALLNSLNPVVDQYFSAQLVIGSVAALGYGLKIPMLIIGLIGISLGNVLLPFFSNLAAENVSTTYIKLTTILKYSLIGSLVVALFLFLLSENLISLLFERKEFTSEHTQIVYRVQQMYTIQIPFYISGLIMNRYLTAINKNNFLVITSFISLVLNTFLNYILIDKFEVYGLALATSIVSIVNTLLIFTYISKPNKKKNV